MCCNTKQKIAQALRSQMRQRPLGKITVQDLMESASMKRQSFYYHFQDVFEVLDWICEQQLAGPLRQDPELDFEDWCIRMMCLLEEDRAFYRRVLASANPAMLTAFCEELVSPRVSRLLFPEAEGKPLDPHQVFAVDFFTQAIISYLVGWVTSRRPIRQEQARAQLHSLLCILNLPGAVPVKEQAG